MRTDINFIRSEMIEQAHHFAHSFIYKQFIIY